MDLLYSNNVDVFCIVSSDSDFTRLAMRLRESGKTVYGIGARKTPTAFQNACDRFTYTEVLQGDTLPTEVDQPAVADPKQPAPDLAVPSIRSILTPAVQATTTEDGWARLSTVGWNVVNQLPSFDSRNYGYEKLGLLVRDQPFLEVKDVPLGNGVNQLWVRLRASGQARPEREIIVRCRLQLVASRPRRAWYVAPSTYAFSTGSGEVGGGGVDGSAAWVRGRDRALAGGAVRRHLPSTGARSRWSSG